MKTLKNKVNTGNKINYSISEPIPKIELLRLNPIFPGVTPEATSQIILWTHFRSSYLFIDENASSRLIPNIPGRGFGFIG